MASPRSLRSLDRSTRSRNLEAIAAAARDPRDVADQSGTGPVCANCVAERQKLAVVDVERIFSRLRAGSVLDSTRPCRHCGGRAAVSLVVLSPTHVGLARTKTSALLRVHPAPSSDRERPRVTPAVKRPVLFECAIAVPPLSEAAPIRVSAATPPDAAPRERVSSEQDGRVLAALGGVPDEALCAACVALTGGLGLADARRLITDLALRGAVRVTADGTCGVCSRRQLVAALDTAPRRNRSRP